MTIFSAKTLLVTLSLAAALPTVGAMAQTQAQAGSGPAAPEDMEKVKQVIVYGNDPCPVSDSGEIMVCARMQEKERYRIPTALRTDPNDPKVQSWLNRAEAIEYVGKSGTDSCSPVGGGGFTGCFQTLARNARAERRTMMGDASWADLVAAERAKRLSVIDADSAKIEAAAKAEEAATNRSGAAPTTTTPYP